MSVVIKGMDMPMHCRECPFFSEIGTCSIQEYLHKKYYKPDDPDGISPGWCPLEDEYLPWDT